MKQALSITRRWCLFSLIVGAAFWWVWVENSDSNIHFSKSAEPKIEEPSAAGLAEDGSVSLDFSSANKSSLLLKTTVRKSNTERGGELWFRDAQGVEWLVANLVVQACFSPDGSKIAYATVGNEIFIETVSGERLITIPNAREPVWRSDSVVLNFSAVLSNEYSDITQSASYDLHSGKITLAARDTTASFPSLK